MARGDHPKRTPFYGVLMIILAMAAVIGATYYGPTWLRVTVYIVAVLVVLFGFVFTFRDYSF